VDGGTEVTLDNSTALRVPGKFRRSANAESASEQAALWLIDHMCGHLGLDDLGDTELLDYGCGVKFTQAFINRSLPIKQYVGVDLYREMIERVSDSLCRRRNT
jgi:cyclopropane fatty-acyl-phospholipid synthase-like methyltransferase